MSSKKLIIYLLISLLCLTALIWSILRKYQSDDVKPVVLNLNAAQNSLQLPSLNSEPLPLDLGEYTQWYIDEKISPHQVSSGREDPFAKLFEELAVVKEDPEIESDLVKVDTPPVTKHGILRGILGGPVPAAYIEEADGHYRKVKIGDAFAGGQIIHIKEDSVVIDIKGQQISIGLGE